MRLLSQSCDLAGGTATRDILRIVEEAHIDGVLLTPPLSDRPDIIEALRCAPLAVG